jgi:argininosuccinate lyase
VLDLFAALAAQIRIDPARVANNIRRSCITITELADSLVRRENLSFREGHEIAAAVAKAVVAMDGDLPVDGFAPFLVAFEKATGRKTSIDAALFAKLVSPEHFVAVRNRFGGPAPEPLAAAIAGYREKSAEFAMQIQRHADVEATAVSELNNKFSALVGAA